MLIFFYIQKNLRWGMMKPIQDSVKTFERYEYLQENLHLPSPKILLEVRTYDMAYTRPCHAHP